MEIILLANLYIDSNPELNAIIDLNLTQGGPSGLISHRNCPVKPIFQQTDTPSNKSLQISCSSSIIVFTMVLISHKSIHKKGGW